MKKNTPVYCCIGLDLAGPVNIKDTAMTVAFGDEDNLTVHELRQQCTDADIYSAIRENAHYNPILAVDAPLSYNQGGGFRDSEKSLISFLKSEGLPRPGIMAPTMTKMVYLTLRGFAISRLLQQNIPLLRIFENHPGASLLLNGFPADLVKDFKKDSDAREGIVNELNTRGVHFPQGFPKLTEHQVAATSCCFAAWQYARKKAAWEYPAKPPIHPFPFIC
jgi:predicted nuclease with RNAse H fold